MAWERLHAQITPEQMAWLRKAAFTQTRPMGEIVRELIDKAMRRELGKIDSWGSCF